LPTLLAATTASSATTTTTSPPPFIVPNGTFIFELIIFIIVVGIVAKFILPSINKVMNERNAQIAEAAHESDAGRAEADRLQSERARVLTEARTEARTLLEAANARAEQARDDARARGQAEHDRIFAEALAQIATERSAIRDELISGLDTLVVGAAERVIGSEVEASHHQDIIERARQTARATVS
jgi:F-type H+-transporting ATPase subunit b